MASFPKQAASLEKAKKRLADAINKRFPIGAAVIVYAGGRGDMEAFIAQETDDECCYVRSASSGKVHRKHYSLVE